MGRNFWLCLILLKIVVGGCDSSATRSQPEPPPSSRPEGSARPPGLAQTAASDRVIVAFGNSLIAGLGVASREAFPAQLEAQLRARGHDYRVVNAGISGETTAGGLRRVEGVIRLKPKIVVLELGANDGLRGVGLEEIRSNLKEIIERLRSENITVVLAGMRLPPNYGPTYAAGFSGLYRELAEEYALPLVPFFLEGVAARKELNQEDGIHPTAEGYRSVVDNVLPILLPLLDDSPRRRPSS